MFTKTIGTTAALSAILLSGCAATTGNSATSKAFNARYHCADGRTVSARYFPPDTAVVTIDGQQIDMHVTRSADGVRYVGGHWVWWTKGGGPGSTATLFSRNTEQFYAGKRITSCTQRL